jgi:phospholipase C
VALFIVALCSLGHATVPPSNHVVVVMLENHSFSSAWNGMPFLRSLAQQYSYAKYSYGNTHPSIGNYFMMSTGQMITNSDGYSSQVGVNNLVRQMVTAGETWKSYAESIPSVGYCGGDRYPYIKHHNPFAYFTDVCGSTNQRGNLVPFTQFTADLANGQLPRFSFVAPNMQHDAHDGSLATADAWLKANIVTPLLADPGFQQDGILIITFDESYSSDTAHGGGHVLTVVIGPHVKRGYADAHNYYQQQSLLRTIEFALAVSKIGAAGSVWSYTGMFP